MRRRRLLAMIGPSALAAPRIATAQAGRRPRLAIFVQAGPEAEVSEKVDSFWRAFFGELRRCGFEEGRTLDVARWSAKGMTARYPELAREIANSQPDVIFTLTQLMAAALQAATTSIPIVAVSSDLVSAGLADGLARPGRNVTGTGTAFAAEAWVKTLELLHEVVPTASRIGFLAYTLLWDTTVVRSLREIAPRVGVTLIGALVHDPIQPPEYRRAFAAMRDQRVEALIVAGSPVNFMHRHVIVELATADRLPLIAGGGSSPTWAD